MRGYRVSGRLLSFLSLSLKMVLSKKRTRLGKRKSCPSFWQREKSRSSQMRVIHPLVILGFVLFVNVIGGKFQLFPYPVQTLLDRLAASGLPTHQFLWAFFPKKHPELKICSNDGRILRFSYFYESKYKSKRHSFFCANSMEKCYVCLRVN